MKEINAIRHLLVMFGIIEARDALCVFIPAATAPIMANVAAAEEKQVFKCKVQSRYLKPLLLAMSLIDVDAFCRRACLKSAHKIITET